MKTKWIICVCCQGNGKVENPAFSNGFTSSEWHEMDEDSQHNYMSGVYDVCCSECDGSGKQRVPDIAALSFAEKRELVVQRREAREDAEWRRESEMIRRAEDGCRFG